MPRGKLVTETTKTTKTEATHRRHHGGSCVTGLDPRTTIAYATIVGLVCLTMAGGDSATMGVIRRVLEVSVGVIMAIDGRWRLLTSYVPAMLVSGAAIRFLTPEMSPTTVIGSAAVWLVEASAVMTVRMAPSAILAVWILSTMRVNELTTAMRRMHVPDSVTIAAAVMLRFLPSAASRNSAVGDAIRMRLRRTRTGAEETRHVEGTRHNEGSQNKPGMMRRGARGMARALDYRIVPLLSGIIAAADDLSQSALTRGLVLGRERTSIARIGFRTRDVMVLAACLTVLPVWALAAAGLVP